MWISVYTNYADYMFNLIYSENNLVQFLDFPSRIGSKDIRSNSISFHVNRTKSSLKEDNKRIQLKIIHYGFTILLLLFSHKKMFGFNKLPTFISLNDKNTFYIELHRQFAFSLN